MEGSKGFWPAETEAASLYETVAKLYARDIGVEPKKIATEEWKSSVAESLRTTKEEDPMAYLAGAFARWGTATGFRVGGSGKGFEIARRISDLNRFTVQLVHESGYPGRTTITVSDGGEAQSAEFFALMRKLKTDAAKEPNQAD